MSVGSGGFCVKRVTMEQVDKVGQTPGSVASSEAGVTGPGDQSSEDILITEAAPEQRGQVRTEVTRLMEAGLC